MVQDVLIQSRLIHGFFYPGEDRSDSVQVEPEHNWIVCGDLEFFEDTIPDSKYLDSLTISTFQPHFPPRKDWGERQTASSTIWLLILFLDPLSRNIRNTYGTVRRWLIWGNNLPRTIYRVNYMSSSSVVLMKLPYMQWFPRVGGWVDVGSDIRIPVTDFCDEDLVVPHTHTHTQPLNSRTHKKRKSDILIQQ